MKIDWKPWVMLKTISAKGRIIAAWIQKPERKFCKRQFSLSFDGKKIAIDRGEVKPVRNFETGLRIHLKKTRVKKIETKKKKWNRKSKPKGVSNISAKENEYENPVLLPRFVLFVLNTTIEILKGWRFCFKFLLSYYMFFKEVSRNSGILRNERKIMKKWRKGENRK